jgi:hypothetical protein
MFLLYGFPTALTGGTADRVQAPGHTNEDEHGKGIRDVRQTPNDGAILLAQSAYTSREAAACHPPIHAVIRLQ